MVPTLITIFENYGVSSIVRVEVIDTDGRYHTVHTASAAKATCPRRLEIDVSALTFEVKAVRINTDQRLLNDWNEIDAVQLMGVRRQ